MFYNSEEVIANIKNIGHNLSPLESIKRHALIWDLLYQKNILLEECMETLIEKNVLHIDTSGKVDALYPFSIKPTDKEILIPLISQKKYYAMCAIDTLGIYYLLKVPILIQSYCPISSDKNEPYRL